MNEMPKEPDEGGAAPKPHTTQVRIDFRRVLDIMGLGVRRASAFMALGMRTATDTTVPNANLEEDFQFKFFPQSVSQETIAEIRTNFGEWVVGNALKELDQFFSLFLDAINEVLTLSSYSGKALEQVAIDDTAEFKNQTSVAVKLDAIKRDYGIESKLRDHVAGLSKARNSLSHGLGVVHKRHLTSADALELTWLGLDVVIGEQVYKTIPDGGIQCEAGTKIEVRVGARDKRVPLGAKIELAPGELSEICFTYWIQATQIVKEAEALVLPRSAQPLPT